MVRELVSNWRATSEWTLDEANVRFGGRIESGRQISEGDGHWLQGVNLVTQKQGLLDIADELAPLIRNGSSSLVAGSGLDLPTSIHAIEQIHVVNFQDEDSWGLHRNGNLHDNLI